MLGNQFGQVRINYETSYCFTGLGTAYVFLNISKVDKVISAQRTVLALLRDL